MRRLLFAICLSTLGVAGFCPRPAWAQVDGGVDAETNADASPANTHAGPANTDTTDAGSALSPAEEQALERALGEDQSANRGKQATATPAQPAQSGLGAAMARVFQSMNPDISAIADFAAGWYSDDTRTIKSGDDPGHTGANLQELELAFQATVDPYFKAQIYLTIPNLEGLEVEEAFVTTTSLPYSLQLRAGIFRAPFGRQNTQHLHMQDFTRRPEMNALFLGTDGLHSPGLELSWMAPTPFYLLFTGAAFSVAHPEELNGPLASFGGGKRSDFTYLGNVRSFAPLSQAASLYFGLSFASGKTGRLVGTDEGEVLQDQYRSFVYGADMYFKWKPPNVAQTYQSLTWTTEYYLRHIPALKDQLEGALYSQVVWQVARRWFLGARGEVDGIPSGPAVQRQYAGSASLTWALSEFSRIRLYGETRWAATPLPTALLPLPRGISGAAFLQIEAAIGAHGAHPY